MEGSLNCKQPSVPLMAVPLRLVLHNHHNSRHESNAALTTGIIELHLCMISRRHKKLKEEELAF